VNKDVIATILGGDEAEALLRVKPLTTRPITPILHQT